MVQLLERGLQGKVFNEVSKRQGRHADNVGLRRMPLSEEARDYRLTNGSGLYTLQGGQRLAIPIDSLSDRTKFEGVKLWTRKTLTVNDVKSLVTVRPGVRWEQHRTLWQGKVLGWVSSHLSREIPYMYYRAVLGHDLHVGVFANLYANHWHTGWTDPFNPEEAVKSFDGKVEGHGFLERLGWLSGAKVTAAFISETVDELVSTTGTEFADFDFQEVGTSNQVESNADTALITTSGISRVSGTPTDSDPDYQSVGTVTADATETWEEWGLFNNSTSVALLDRSTTGGQSVNSSDQVQYTYVMTLNKEAD